MSSFISGPVIKFQVDTAAVEAELKKVYAAATAQAKASAAQIRTAATDPLQQQAAKLRALYSTGAIGIKELQVQQKAFVAQLDAEIGKLSTRNNLTKQELATLKQMTLERERQANALQRGVGVGVTSGTQSALGLVTGSLQRNIGQLGSRIIGLAGGSGASEFQAAATGIASISAEAGPAVGILGAFVTTLVAAGVAAANLAIQGGQLAERLSNISQRTGIPIRDLQVLEAVAKTAELSLEDIVTGFRKFSQALTGGAGGEAGGFEGAGKKSADILKILGVTSKDSFEAIEQVADAFRRLPDGPVKSAAAIELFGRSGLQLIPILNKGRDGIEEYRGIVAKLAPEINDNVLKAQNDWEKSSVALGLTIDKLKVKLSPLQEALAKFGDPDTGGFFEKFLVLITQGTPGMAGFFAETKTGAQLAADEWKRLGLGFDDAIDAAKKLSPVFDALQKKLDGQADAAKKAAEELKREIAALNSETFKKASETIQQIFGAAQGQGLSPEQSIFHRQVEEIQKIADAMQNVSDQARSTLAPQAAAAIDAIFAATTRDLNKLADEALIAVDKQLEEEEKKLQKQREDLAKLIKGVDDDLAITRAEAAGNAAQKIIAEEQKRFDETTAKAKELGATEQQLQDLRVKFNEEAQDKIQNLRREELKKTQDEIKNTAGRLFDSLVSGSRSFGQALRQALLSAALTPIKLIFEAVVTAIFTPIVTRIKDLLKSVGDSLKGKGGILGEIGKILSPETAIDKNVASVNLNTTATSANTDAILGLTQALTVGGGGVSGAGNNLFGSFFTPPGGIGAPNTGGITPAGGGFLGALLRGVGAAAPGLFLGLGNAIGGRNIGVRIGGGITATGASLSGIGAGLNNATLQKFGAIGQGAGLVISGISDGGLKGAGEAALGGAQIGTAIAPGIGTAIGAVAGFFAGLIGGLFHHGPSQADIARAVRRQTVNPADFIGKEFDRAAESSFAQTVGTLFTEGPGGIFSDAAAVGGPRQAPAIYYAPQIHALDATGVDRVLELHGLKFARAAAKYSLASNSGFGSAVRQAVSPA